MMNLHFIACTRGRKEDTHLHRSLARLRLDSVQFFENNRAGLAECYNRVLNERAGRDEILVFLHDDVLLTDAFVADKLNSAVDRCGFAVTGIAGASTFEIAPANQPSRWLKPQANKGNSGAVEHTFGDETTAWSAYGPVPGRCIVMDGLFLAVDARRIGNVRFDEQFKFHFYDLDFCLSADRQGLLLGTANVHLTHNSLGKFEGEAFADAQSRFRAKWRRPGLDRVTVGSGTILLDNPAIHRAFHSGPLRDWMVPLCHLPDALPQSVRKAHVPFLSLVTHLTRPRVCVELGVERGASFLATCSAAQRFETQTRYFGVDAWDRERVFTLLDDYVSKHFADAKLIRSPSDAALGKFADGSIDLLQIAGAQRAGDWLPKLSDRAVVLVHGTREAGSAAQAFWDGSKGRYPGFEFEHGSGLGMLAIGGRVPTALQGLLQFVQESPENAGIARKICAVLGGSLDERMARRDACLPESLSAAAAAFVRALGAA